MKRILVEQDCARLPLARRLEASARRAGGAEYRVVRPGDGEIRDLRGGKHGLDRMKTTLLLTQAEEFYFRECGAGTGNPACDYQVEFAWGCPNRCAFCQDLHLLKDTPYVEIYPDLDRVLYRIARIAHASDRAPLVFETGSFSDLLALEPWTGILRDMIPRWTRRIAPRAHLQFLTKSDRIDLIAGLDHGGCVRIGFTVNLDRFMQPFAGSATGSQPSWKAVRAALEGGYRLHLSFSPIFWREGILPEYDALLEETRDALDGLENFDESDLTLEAITFFQRKGGEDLVRRHFPGVAEEVLLHAGPLGDGPEGLFGYPEAVREELRAFFREGFARRFPRARVLFVS